MRIIVAIVAFIIMVVPGSLAHAGFVEYKGQAEAKQAWSDAVGGDFTTLNFDFGQQTIVTDQYAALGALFTDGQEITDWGPNSFPNDSWGLAGAFPGYADAITVEFSTPMNWIGVDHPGFVFYELFSDDQLVYTSTWSGFPSGPRFFGIVSTISFDKAVIIDPIDNSVFIDDLFYGPAIPAAPGLAVLGLGMLGATGLVRGRRRGA